MSILTRVVACLEAHRGVPWCVACIARELGLSGVSVKGVYEAVRRLAFPSRPGFVRERGMCAPCEKIRMVAYFQAAPPRGDS